MAFDAGTLKGYLTLDNKQYTDSITKSQKQTNTFGGYIEKNSKKIKGMGVAMSVAGGLIVAGLTKTFKAASDAAEVSTKFAFTFKDIKEKSGVALKELVNNYGMSVVSGQKLLASTGDIYKGFGANSDKALELSLRIQKLAADHTSFNNVQGGVARASEIITKATLGERDGLIQLGIKVDEQMVKDRLAKEGKDKLTGAALYLAKSEATLALITEQSGGAIGDYGRTAEGTANQSRLFSERMTDLKVVIGTQLLPVITPLITEVTGFITKLAEWAKEHPGLTKAILTTTAALGGLMLIVGPVLIALPKLAAGFAIAKGALETLYLRALYATDAFTGLLSKMSGSFIGKLGLFAGATYAVVKAWNAIDNILGPSIKKLTKLSMIKMGWTEQGKQALYLKNSLIELAKKIDPTVTGLRSAAIAIKNNETAYNDLHPRLKRIVDGMADFESRTRAAANALPVLKERTQENINIIQGITEASSLRIQELTLSETDFKIAQLDREYQKNIEILNQNAATKEELQLVERAHTLAIAQIRDEAYLAQKEKEKKRIEEEKKAKEEEKKKKEEEIKKEEERQQQHFDFIEGLKKEQQTLVLQQIEERDGWRVAELTRIDMWESDQLQLVQTRLADELITWQEFQDEKSVILDTATMKREQIEDEARKRQEEADNQRNQRMMSEFDRIVSEKQRKMDKYFTFLSNLNTAYTALRDSNLQSWYDEELRRINESGLSNEERTAAIEDLDSRMYQKKAALEAQAQKRERAMAIAQAIANTAVAITTALKALPWPLNLPAIAFAIATGAAQIAAIGGAYSGSSIGDYSGDGGGGGGGGGAGIGDGGGAGGRKAPAYQSGTNGYITPPSDFLVGEPYSTERVQLRGNLQNVGMSITPLGQTLPANSGTQINLDFSGMHVIDATDFENRVREFLPRLMQKFIDAGYINIPRSRVG